MDLLAAPQQERALRSTHLASTFQAEPSTLLPATASPIVVFEWEISRGELSDGRLEILDALALGHSPGQDERSGKLTWFGDIDVHLGYGEGEFPRTIEAWAQALHPEDRERVLQAIARHLQTQQPYFEACRAQCKDGSYLSWTHSGVITPEAQGQPQKLTATFSNIVHNTDAGEQAEQHAREEKARAQSLLRTAAHLNAQLDLKQVSQAICEEAARIINAPVAVMLFDKASDAFVPSATINMPHDYAGRYTPTKRSIYDGHVRAMGSLFLFTDAQATPDLPNHKLYLEVDMRTIGIASLIREGEVLGLLKVYSFVQSRTFDDNELALLQGLADIAAQAIANARLYSESQRRLANLHSLRQIDMAILGSSEVNIALNVVLDQVVSQLGSDAASILLLKPHTRVLRYAAGRGFRTATPRRTDWRLGEGLAGRAALERRMIYVPDLSRPDVIAVDFSDPELKLPGINPLLDSLSGQPTSGEQSSELSQSSDESRSIARSRRTGVLPNEGFVSYHAVPLVASSQVRGVLEVWHRAPLRLDEEGLEFLETLAAQAAIAIENAGLFRDLQRSNDELVLAYDSTLEGWSGALDLRDKETEGHTQRVTEETLRLAQFMGLSDAELVHIRRGALLHDIGKMGIPDAILLKPGSLTDEEWIVMRKHPVYAYELLSPIQYLRPALDIPYSHHEKWDGSGYPRGLSGDQISLAARIFAVIDVWDALCSDRPYRKGWPIERVLEHIQASSGSHFDPEVVKAFLQMHAAQDAEHGQVLAASSTPTQS